MTTTRILARTDDLVFVDKPAGLLVHCSAWAGPRERALVDEVFEQLGAGWHPLHRLDRQTSGVVAFACERPAGNIARWQAALAGADKRYWALVRGHVMQQIEVDHPMRDDGATAQEAPKAARSLVMPLLRSQVARCSLVEVRLFSGRRHQARRHLKHIAHPVIGDANHGKGPINRAYREAWGVTRMALHARALALPDDGANGESQGARAVACLPSDLRAPLVSLFGEQAIRALDTSDRDAR